MNFIKLGNKIITTSNEKLLLVDNVTKEFVEQEIEKKVPTKLSQLEIDMELGGGSKLYRHIITISKNYGSIVLEIITNDSTPITSQTFYNTIKTIYGNTYFVLKNDIFSNIQDKIINIIEVKNNPANLSVDYIYFRYIIETSELSIVESIYFENNTNANLTDTVTEL